MTVKTPSPPSPWSTPFRDAWRTVVPAEQDRDWPFPPFLLGLTLVTGLVDAFSYLALGHVFVANMTGNVVFLAFAVAGAPGFSITASLLALVAFVVGAAVGGRFATALGDDRHRLLSRTALAEGILFAAAAVVTAIGRPDSESVRDLLIVTLALAMGMQNAAVRRLAVADLTTTVLTLTITGIAADGRLGAGGDGRVGRRTVSVVAMFSGALIGAVVVLAGSAAVDLLLAFGVAAAITVGMAAVRRSGSTPA